MTARSAAEMLERDEGYEESAYTDTEGLLTIGIGHLIDRRRGGKIDRDIIYQILSRDISKHTGDLYSVYPWAAELDEPRRAVLICMCFQLGITALSQFVQAMKYMQNGEYTAASLAFLDSKVAREQAPVRWKRFAEQIKTGEWI